MNLIITGVGIWGRGWRNWPEFVDSLDGDPEAAVPAFETPKPEAIPARERRRAGLTINLAVEVMEQACRMAGCPRSGIGSVFASAMGDTEITDYMCRKLATEDRLLSPTRFHNSVHNAPSGYWSISAENRQPSSFVGGFRDSFATGLLEAAVCAAEERIPVGLAAYDVANGDPFADVLAITDTLGLALVLCPESPSAQPPTTGPAPAWHLRVRVAEGRTDAAQAARPALRERAAANPAGAGIALLEALADGATSRLQWPVGSGTLLEIEVEPCAPR